MSDSQLDFCHQFQYPPQLKNSLLKIIKITSQETIETIFLIGSTARGEISIKTGSDSFDLWSDIEFFIVVQPGKSVNEQQLRDAYQELSYDLDVKNPFFHIDFAVVPLNKLSNLPRQISTFEAKKTGRVLWGKDIIRYHLPEVTLENLDYGNTNHLILIRLTEMLLHIPWRVVVGCANRYEEAVFSYIQVRNALDILTIILPHEGVLLPSYTARNNYLQQHYHELRSQTYMGTGFSEFLSEALDSKLHLKFNTLPVQLYQNVLVGYVNLLRFLLKIDAPKDLIDLSAMIEKNPLNLASQNFLTYQRISEWRTLVKHIFSNKVLLTPSNYKKRLIIILLFLHQGLLWHLQGDKRALSLLRETRQRLQFLYVRSIPPTGASFAEEWLILRQTYVDLFTTFYIGKRSQISYYKQVLAWQYDQ